MIDLSPEAMEATRALVASLSALLRVARDDDEGAIRLAADRFAAKLIDADPPMVLQLDEHAYLRDGILVPLEIGSFLHLQDVAAALRRAGAHDLRFDAVPPTDDLMRVAVSLAATDRQDVTPIHELELTAMSCTPAGEVLRLHGPYGVPPEIQARTEIVVAVATAEALDRDEPGWSSDAGVHVLRRVERAAARDPLAALGGVELEAAPWTPARRAVSAALLAMITLDRLSVDVRTRRATCHAALAVGLHGYRERGGLAIEEAAAAMLEDLLAVAGGPRSTVSPHHLRVCALAHCFATASERRTPWTVPMHIMHLVYELQRRRLPETVHMSLTLVDLLAHATGKGESTFESRLARVLIDAVGLHLPGTRVRLADGRCGVIIGPGIDGAPERPRVWVEDEVFTPEKAVVPISALSAAT